MKIIHENLSKIGAQNQNYYNWALEQDEFTTLQSKKRESGQDIFVAIDSDNDDKPCALLEISYLWPERAPFLSWLYVEPQYRNINLSEELIEAAEKYLKQMQFSHYVRSACSLRPLRIEHLKKIGGIEAGSLIFPDKSIEYFFWFELK